MPSRLAKFLERVRNLFRLKILTKLGGAGMGGRMVLKGDLDVKLIKAQKPQP